MPNNLEAGPMAVVVVTDQEVVHTLVRVKAIVVLLLPVLEVMMATRSSWTAGVISFCHGRKNLVKLELRVSAACNIVRDSILCPEPVVTVASCLDMQ
jgi:hypothetical protein